MRQLRYWAPHTGPFAGKPAPKGYAVLLIETVHLWERFTREGWQTARRQMKQSDNGSAM